MANRRRRSLRGRCPIQHKGSFSSYRAALKVARGTKEPGRVYWHAECGMYHITRQDSREHAQRLQLKLQPERQPVQRYTLTAEIEAARWLPDDEQVRIQVMSWVLGKASSVGYEQETKYLTIYNTDSTREVAEPGEWIMWFGDDPSDPGFSVTSHEAFIALATPIDEGADAA